MIAVRDATGRMFCVIDAISDYPEAGTWVLGLLLVAPEHRGKGLGREIVGKFAAWTGARRLRLGVQTTNVSGRAFWDRLGFRTIERVMQPLSAGVFETDVMICDFGG